MYVIGIVYVIYVVGVVYVIYVVCAVYVRSVAEYNKVKEAT
jgi:hypothetical protein